MNYKLAQTPWNHDNIFSIPLQFRDRGLSFNSNYTCLDEENYGRRNGFFFSISDKGWKRRKGKEKETCNRATTSNLALILTRVIFFGVPADAPYVLQPLKIISTVDLLSWLLYNKNWLQETGRHLSPVGEGEEFGRYRYYNGHNRCHKHKDCRANGCLAKSLLIDQ